MPTLETRRPVAVTTLAVVQTAIAVLNVVAVVTVWMALRSPEVSQGPHAAEDVHAIRLSVGVLAVAALLTALAAIGLWRRWAAGWALTLALALTVLLGMLWGPIFDHDHMESDDVAIVVTFAVTIVLALLGPVRHWYLRPRTTGTTVPATSDKLKTGY
jgi:hypothetical protein